MNLFEKYDRPVPRYTSYPTVPYWSEPPKSETWIESMERSLSKPDAKLSLYMHIPFCETLCTFCGCNNVITKNHDLEIGYVELLLQEWKTYLERGKSLLRAPLQDLHLGGGTPTFLSADHLKMLLEPVLSTQPLDEKFEASIEIDPRRLKREQLQVLFDLGFRRVSLGVQDFDSNVQRLINRHQSVEQTEQSVQWSREIGFHSVNLDLIYGLPKQELASFRGSMETTLRIRPDRIALYSFAFVPWIKAQQRLFNESDCPQGKEKRELYELARKMLLDGGYEEIGMDHFALPTDGLSIASKQGTLHRNFMGYTDRKSSLMLALGVSGIGESQDCYHQNEKVFPLYAERVKKGEIPTLRGHILNHEDQVHKEKILSLMTKGKVSIVENIDFTRKFLREMEEDELIHWEGDTLTLTEKGKPFLRNACLAFDMRLHRKDPQGPLFSKSL